MNQNPTPDVQNAQSVLSGKSRIRSFILGIFIGLAIILPGISGSTVAIILGLYTAMLYAMGHLASKEFKPCFLFLLPLGIGAVIGFLGGFIVVQKVFGPYVFEMVTLFTGLMTGAFPTLLGETRGEKITPKRGALFAIGFILPIAIALISFFFLPEINSEATFTDFPALRYFAYLPLGILVSLTQIVPGLSATAILMAFGQFGLILNSVHVDYILAHPEVLLLYASLAIGFGVGLLFLSRILSDILAKYKKTAFFMIIGLSVGSIVSMFLSSDMMACYRSFGELSAFPVLRVILGAVLFAIGFIVAYLLVLYEKKHDIAPS